MKEVNTESQIFQPDQFLLINKFRYWHAKTTTAQWLKSRPATEAPYLNSRASHWIAK